MPSQYTYPGVYVEEIPSGVRTITGVATSITAFVGRARMGPINEPVRVQSFGDFERIFGGLWAESPMTYAVQQFFANGGGDALVVRLIDSTAKSASISMLPERPGQVTVKVIPENNAQDIQIDAQDSFIGKAKISIPKNAVSSKTEVSISPAWPFPADEYVLLGPPVFTHASGPFKEGIEVEVTIPAPKYTNQTQTGILMWDGGGTPSFKTASVSNEVITHKFSRLAVFQAAAKAAPSPENAEIDKPQEEKKITAKDDRIKGTTVLVFANAAEKNTIINIAAGESRDLQNRYVPVGPVVTTSTSKPFLREVEVSIPFELPPVIKQTDIVVLAWIDNQFTLFPTPIVENQTVKIATKRLGSFQAAFDIQRTAAASTNHLLKVKAKSHGTWGNDLRAIVDYATRDPKDRTLFNLKVVRVDPATDLPQAEESFLNLSTQADSPRYAVSILQEESKYISLESTAAIRPLANSSERPYRPNIDGADGNILTSGDYTAGLGALEKADLFNLLCIPPPSRDTNIDSDVWSAAVKYCGDRRAILLVDPPWGWNTVGAAEKGMQKPEPVGPNKNAAVFWPFLRVSDPLKENLSFSFAPCGAVAGVIARTDRERGIWKAPAGLDATLSGVQGLTVKMTDAENGLLNPLGLNCLRSLPLVGPVVWGARTSVGADRLASEWKYLPVRRMALYIEESLYRGLKWVVFEPNDERLWSQIRLNAGAFMQGLFRDGAFQGSIPQQAYFVKCDAETNPQGRIDQGIVTVKVGFAPLKPAEFVVIQIQQMTGDILT